MSKIAIISSSVRDGRNSHRVALFFQNYLIEHQLASVEILDLKGYKFPVFESKLRFQEDPPESLLDFAARINAADGVIIVTPEYNGSFPASIKNAVDVLYEEWRRKPIAISTVSDGNFGGTQVIMALQWTLWKIKSWTVPAMFPVPNIKTAFDENGVPADREAVEKRAKVFIEELLWCIEARKRMEEEV